MSTQLLTGIRVLDAASLAAGPLIATWMGEFGADVIKVEQPGRRGAMRKWVSSATGSG